MAKQNYPIFQIRVGMQFFRNSSLQLRNPKNIANAGSYSKISLYFNTDQRNGFLAYVGPDASTFGQLATVSTVNYGVFAGFRYLGNSRQQGLTRLNMK